MTHGGFGLSGYSPWAAITSAKHSPAARTRTRTCPGPGSGSGVSRTRNPAGPFVFVIHTARMSTSSHHRGRGVADAVLRTPYCGRRVASAVLACSYADHRAWPHRPVGERPG